MSKINSWDEKAQKLWDNNEKTQAIHAVFDAINIRVKNNKPADVNLFRQSVFYLYFSADYPAALTMIKRVLELTPNDLEMQQNYIVCLNRVEEYEEAIRVAKDYLAVKTDNPMIYDVLSVAYREIGETQKAIEVGTQALSIKHESVKSTPRHQIIEQNIKVANLQGATAYLASQPKRTRHVIAFSLFGNESKYLFGAIRNLSLRDDLYKGWEMWIYHDASVPENFLKLYSAMGANLISMPSGSRLRDQLTWRFLPANHPEVARFLVRDIDSIINIREVTAVDEWIGDETLFHVMRDWWSHTELILAGMWGGVGGLLPDIAKAVTSYKDNTLDNTHTDQHFLRTQLWVYVMMSLSQHDRFFHLNNDEVTTHNPWAENLVKQESLGINNQIKIGSCEGIDAQWQQNKVAPWLMLMEKLTTTQASNIN